jgi:tRNA pseudouridine38-40 synthase
MHYYKTTIQYAGTNYNGLQWQKDLTTVQSEYNRALADIHPDKFTTMAASRTDTGVHAFEQVVKISTSGPIDLPNFLALFNRTLPSDICCLSINECSGTFKPSVDAVKKEYRYFFTNKLQVSPLEREFIANISNPLSLDNMFACIQALKGEHDFCNFTSSGSNVKSTVRVIEKCNLTFVNPQEIFKDSPLFKIPGHLSECFQLQIIANGFLKQMIRHIVRALWMVGSGKLSVAEFKMLLDGPKNKKQQWKVASPNGLFLYKITYPEL